MMEASAYVQQQCAHIYKACIVLSFACFLLQQEKKNVTFFLNTPHAISALVFGPLTRILSE